MDNIQRLRTENRFGAGSLFILCAVILLSPLYLSEINGQALTETKQKVKKEPLEFDALEKSQHTNAGDKQTIFKFTATNTGTENVIIEDVQTSCGCTSVMKKSPWIIKPGASDVIEVHMDILGRTGTVTKSVYVFTNLGAQALKVKSIIPLGKGKKSSTNQGKLSERQKNQILALRDRQIVFRGKCAKCHATPTKGLTGRKLYDRACGICHNSPNQASIVPNLAKLNKTMDKIYWEVWIKYGRKGSLMPAFHKSQGGPLDDKQISSLVDYLLKNKPTGTVKLPQEMKMEEENEKAKNIPARRVGESNLGKFNVLRPITDPRPKGGNKE